MTTPVHDENLKVSVSVITYNSERFIRQALDSVRCQRTDFPYEVLISEDFSTDHTQEIIQEYQRAHPTKVCLLLSERNLRGSVV